MSEADVFAEAAPIPPSLRLQETLDETMAIALAVSTEKAKSELIISPVLVEARWQFMGHVSLFQLIVQAPVVAVMEAKNDNLKSGLGQCFAELLTAQRFNARRGLEILRLYGVVTTGSLWKFLCLSGS